MTFREFLKLSEDAAPGAPGASPAVAKAKQTIAGQIKKTADNPVAQKQGLDPKQVIAKATLDAAQQDPAAVNDLIQQPKMMGKR